MREGTMSVASEAFRDLYGYHPEGVWAAPGRVNLIGEHVDYNEGLVLPFAIDLKTYLAARARSDRVVRLFSVQSSSQPVAVNLDDLQPGKVGSWEAYVLGVLWAMDVPHGFDLLIDGHVPIGSGLSSSASLVSVSALAVDELLGLGHSRQTLVRFAIEAENDFVGAPTGPMDQTASMLCREGHALLYDFRSGVMQQIPFDPVGSGLEAIVIDTSVAHQHADGAYAERRTDCAAAVERLGVSSLRELEPDDLDAAMARLADDRLARRTRHVVTEIERVTSSVAALRDNDWEALGTYLNASHESLRDDFEVSCIELDTAVGAAIKAGALGARMTGGGFGGSAIALVPVGKLAAVERAVYEAFEVAGFVAPKLLSVSPSDGASRFA